MEENKNLESRDRKPRMETRRTKLQTRSATLAPTRPCKRHPEGLATQRRLCQQDVAIRRSGPGEINGHQWARREDPRSRPERGREWFPSRPTRGGPGRRGGRGCGIARSFAPRRSPHSSTPAATFRALGAVAVRGPRMGEFGFEALVNCYPSDTL